MKKYQICSNCIMDTSDPDIYFDEAGVCSNCHSYWKVMNDFNKKVIKKEDKLKEIVKQIKEDCKNDPYDCVLGISGGVDSAYLAYLARECNLRILAVHVDAGWNSEVAVSNIKNYVQHWILNCIQL